MTPREQERAERDLFYFYQTALCGILRGAQGSGLTTEGVIDRVSIVAEASFKKFQESKAKLKEGKL